MSFGSMFNVAIKGLFAVFKRTFLPDKKDLIGSIILTIPLYLLFGLSLIFLLPLIIVGVFIVFIIRRLWMAFIIFCSLSKDIASVSILSFIGVEVPWALI